MRGTDRRARVVVHARGPYRFSGRVHDTHLVTDDEADLDDRECREHDQREDEGEFDRRLAAFTAGA